MAFKDKNKSFESYWSDDKLKDDNTLITVALAKKFALRSKVAKI